jgi:hypothetical protein
MHASYLPIVAAGLHSCYKTVMRQNVAASTDKRSRSWAHRALCAACSSTHPHGKDGDARRAEQEGAPRSFRNPSKSESAGALILENGEKLK